MGKIRLSRQAVLEGWSVEEAQERDKKSGGGNRPGGGGRPGGGHRPGGRDNDRQGGGRNRR